MTAQPPSGGCVLKQDRNIRLPTVVYSAAFGRLCVETLVACSLLRLLGSAAFGRLCVETDADYEVLAKGVNQPPSGGCVLKHQ